MKRRRWFIERFCPRRRTLSTNSLAGITAREGASSPGNQEERRGKTRMRAREDLFRTICDIVLISINFIRISFRSLRFVQAGSRWLFFAVPTSFCWGERLWETHARGNKPVPLSLSRGL